MSSMAPQFAYQKCSALTTRQKNRMSSLISAAFPCRIDQHERLKSSLRAAGLVWRQENHADKLREGREELNEYEGEERPEAIPDPKVDHLERHRTVVILVGSSTTAATTPKIDSHRAARS